MSEIEEKQTQMTIRLPIELYKNLLFISKQMGLTVTSLLIVVIWRNVLMKKKKECTK